MSTWCALWVQECEEKDAELEALRVETVQSQHLADQLRALQAQQQEERVHDANFPYDRCTAAEAGVLVAENLRGHRPRHVDRSKLFTAVKVITLYPLCVRVSQVRKSDI